MKSFSINVCVYFTFYEASNRSLSCILGSEYPLGSSEYVSCHQILLPCAIMDTCPNTFDELNCTTENSSKLLRSLMVLPHLCLHHCKLKLRLWCLLYPLLSYDTRCKHLHYLLSRLFILDSLLTSYHYNVSYSAHLLLNYNAINSSGITSIVCNNIQQIYVQFISSIKHEIMISC